MGYGASLDLPWVKSPEASGNTGDYPTSKTVNMTIMPFSINKLSTNEAKDLISSCILNSATLTKLLPINICRSVVMALVDSGNGFYNALSSAVAKKFSLLQYQPYKGSPVGTASVGSSLNIVEVIPSIHFILTDDTGKEHQLTSRQVVAKDLWCGLNISLPFMVEHGLDQLHSQGIISMTLKNVRFPLYRDINHARRRLKTEKIENPKISVITLGNNSTIVSSKVRQTIPPRTGKLISVNLDKMLVNNSADSVFSYKNYFIQKINKLHPDQDESYLGLNSIDQAVSVSN